MALLEACLSLQGRWQISCENLHFSKRLAVQKPPGPPSRLALAEGVLTNSMMAAARLPAKPFAAFRRVSD